MMSLRRTMKQSIGKIKRFQQIVLVFVGVAVAGCDVGDTERTLNPTAPIKIVVPKPASDAGLGATIDAAPENGVAMIAARKFYGVRADAFALLPVERLFERDQMSARLMSDGGGYQDMFVLPEDTSNVALITEPTPQWRLSGVVISDGVAALLDMGGKVIDIHPGMKIPDTEWVVVSIDAEHAVLKRENGKLPRTFVVPLQSGFSQGTPSGGTGGGAGGGGKLGGGGGQTGAIGGD